VANDEFDLVTWVNGEVEKDAKPPEPTPEDKLRLAYQDVTAKAPGIEVLRHIFAITGFQDRLVRTNSESEINVNATIYNLAQRDLWLQVRQYLSPTQIRAIENPEE